MDKEIFQVPAEINKLTTMINGSIRLQIDTQENITADHLRVLLDSMNKVGWFNFAIREIEAADMIDLPKISVSKTDSKTSSQRLRNTIYVLHIQKGGSKDNFEVFYNSYMEKMIDFVKSKLEKNL
ncbi:MAG: hypothetical protein GWP19_07895 [Planctomycetia bacterium]|nr:hypothetical protein [Planctomycetia bacterium]